jgi:two-component system, OmpR family, heavy metal sensor histidine kinase CusS
MRLSIGRRLTMWYGGLFALALLLFGAVVYSVFSRTLLVEVDRAIAEELDEVQKAVHEAPDREALQRRLNDEFDGHELYVIQINTAAGEPFFRNENARRELPSDWRTETGGFTSVRLAAGRDYRGAARDASGPAGDFIIYAADALDVWRDAVNRLLLVMWCAAPAVLAVGLGGGWWMSRRALAPVDGMIDTVRQITADRLDRRVSVANPDDELGRLAATFNAMIARLERTFDEIRRFTADAAHELRTPLSVLRSEAEVVLRADRSPGQYRRTLENQVEEIDRLSRLADQLLFLCREEGRRTGDSAAPVRLDRLLGDLADDLQPAAEEKGLSLETAAFEPCVVNGDVEGLRRLFLNLLDNALKYTPAGGTVRLELNAGPDRCQAVVADTGIGIAAEHLEHLFERFYRVETSRTAPGFGLGLAICRAIADSHGGRIHVSSAPGAGTRFEVRLPASPVTAETPFRGNRETLATAGERA